MLKKILFVSALFCAGFVSAQSFELLDANDVDISTTTHYEYGSAEVLGNTLFRVRNLTGSPQAFAVKVEKFHVPYSNSGLAICIGIACCYGDPEVDGPQILNNGNGDDIDGNAIYTNFKVSPITWPWMDCATDSAVWKVTVYDPENLSDEASATIIWRCGYPVKINELHADFVRLNSFPNPASSALTINYAIDAVFTSAFVEFYDVLGQKLLSTKLTASTGQVHMNVESFTAGIYFYAIKVDGQTVQTERVVVH